MPLLLRARAGMPAEGWAVPACRRGAVERPAAAVLAGAGIDFGRGAPRRPASPSGRGRRRTRAPRWRRRRAPAPLMGGCFRSRAPAGGGVCQVPSPRRALTASQCAGGGHEMDHGRCGAGRGGGEEKRGRGRRPAARAAALCVSAAGKVAASRGGAGARMGVRAEVRSGRRGKAGATRRLACVTRVGVRTGHEVVASGGVWAGGAASSAADEGRGCGSDWGQFHGRRHGDGSGGRGPRAERRRGSAATGGARAPGRAHTTNTLPTLHTLKRWGSGREGPCAGRAARRGGRRGDGQGRGAGARPQKKSARRPRGGGSRVGEHARGAGAGGVVRSLGRSLGGWGRSPPLGARPGPAGGAGGPARAVTYVCPTRGHKTCDSGPLAGGDGGCGSRGAQARPRAGRARRAFRPGGGCGP